MRQAVHAKMQASQHAPYKGPLPLSAVSVQYGKGRTITDALESPKNFHPRIGAFDAVRI